MRCEQKVFVLDLLESITDGPELEFGMALKYLQNRCRATVFGGCCAVWLSTGCNSERTTPHCYLYYMSQLASSLVDSLYRQDCLMTVALGAAFTS
jgi:hypothetical protein